MTCPHLEVISERAISCRILASVGASRQAGPAMPNHPCKQCQTEWVNGVAPNLLDQQTWTPTIMGFSIPSFAPLPVEQSRGLGDTVATVLSAVGVKKRKGCGCSKRQAWLNRVVPYKKKTPPHPS